MEESERASSDVLERFLRYVQVDTQSSDEHADQVPSSAIQFDLARLLAEELRELGAEQVAVSENAYVTARSPPAPERKDGRLSALSPISTRRRSSRALA